MMSFPTIEPTSLEDSEWMALAQCNRKGIPKKGGEVKLWTNCTA